MKTSPTPQAFRSPVTLGPLQETQGKWVCGASGAKFPIVDGIPFLVPDAERALGEWRMRAVGLVSHYEKSIADLKEELKAKDLMTTTRERLERTRAMTIQHVEFLRSVLDPLKPSAKMPQGIAAGLGYRLPPNQPLQGYFPNLIRDWSSSSGENEASFEILERALGAETGDRTLVLGAGACRLAYDFHRRGFSKHVICADINPILFLAARKILRGETLKAVHFPTAPKNLEAAAGAVRECKAPNGPVGEGFSQVFADVYYLPFEDSSLDTVVTPWLVDILPHRFSFLVQEINRVLRPGGSWINSGSLNFMLGRWTDCLSPEEALELAGREGFAQEHFSQESVPYLHSENDAHARTETVTSFRLRKIAESEDRKAAPMKPLWLSDLDVSVPASDDDARDYVVMESQALVLALIDGKRSVREISMQLGSRYGLSFEDSVDAVSSFLARRHDGRIFRF